MRRLIASSSIPGQARLCGGRLEMVNLMNPRSLLNENGSAIRAACAVSHCTEDDWSMKVTELPSHGSVVRQNGATIDLGDTLTPAELAGLSFRLPMDGSKVASRPLIERRLNGSILYLAQNSGPTP